MKKGIIFIILCAASCVTLLQAQEMKNSAFQFSIVPPVGTQGAEAFNSSNKVSINLLLGISQNERKFTLGGIANVISNNASGCQIAGISNIIGNNANGFKLAGVSNTIGNNGNGILLAGILNTSRDYNGMEISGILNAASNFNEFQISGIGNIAKNANGFQIAGIGNVAKTLNGFQIAGIGNMAEDLNGFQIAGIFNKAKNVNGFQIAGILNMADHSDYPIGLVNLIKDGEKGIGISYNEIGSTVLSFRSGGKVMYGILGLGYNYRSISKQSALIEAGIGAHINYSRTFRINTEITSKTYGLFKENETTQYSLAVLPAFKYASHLEIFGGPTFNFLRSDNRDNEDLFPGNACISLWKSSSTSRLEQGYIGFTIGTQFIF
jgi:hypothetical protein